MNKIKFIIFSLFDHIYKLGNKSPDQGIGALFLLQSFSILIIILLMDRFLNFSIISYLVKTRTSLLFGGLLYFLNYWYFIKKKGAEKLIEQFENDEINTRRNRMIARFKFFTVLILIIAINTFFALFIRHNYRW